METFEKTDKTDQDTIKEENNVDVEEQFEHHLKLEYQVKADHFNAQNYFEYFIQSHEIEYEEYTFPSFFHCVRHIMKAYNIQYQYYGH